MSFQALSAPRVCPQSVKVWQETWNEMGSAAGRNSCPFFNYRSGYELPGTHPAARNSSVRLQKRMLCARLKTGVAPVDLLLDLLGHGAVLLLQQMPGASHHAQPFRDRDFLIARSRIIIQRCDALKLGSTIRGMPMSAAQSTAAAMTLRSRFGLSFQFNGQADSALI